MIVGARGFLIVWKLEKGKSELKRGQLERRIIPLSENKTKAINPERLLEQEKPPKRKRRNRWLKGSWVYHAKAPRLTIPVNHLISPASTAFLRKYKVYEVLYN